MLQPDCKKIEINPSLPHQEIEMQVKVEDCPPFGYHVAFDPTSPGPSA